MYGTLPAEEKTNQEMEPQVVFAIRNGTNK